MRQPDPAKAMQVLEAIYLFYGEGEHWTRGTRGLRNDRRGKHCLVGAIELHCQHPATMRAVVDYIGAAIWPRSDRICDVLVRARKLARRDMERQQPEIAAQRSRRPIGKRHSVVVHGSGCNSAVIPDRA